MTEVTDIPVLFALSGDPVELGIVKSLGEPGGNFTGSTFLSLELAGKRVELLKEVVPTLRTLAVLSNSLHPGEQSEWRATQEAAKALGIELSTFPLPAQTNWTTRWRRRATRARMRCWSFRTSSRWCTGPRSPSSPSRIGCRRCSAGANIATPADLMSYGANQRATYFGLATYADRILRGEKPANLPVVQPTKFELVVNLRTAEQLGIDLDKSSVLFRANKVIE